MTYVTIVSFSKQKLYIEMMLNQKKVWVLKERGTRGTISSNWYHTKNSRKGKGVRLKKIPWGKLVLLSF